MDDTKTRRRFVVPPRLRWLIWVGGLVVWTYLLVVPVDWLPPFLRAKTGGTFAGLTPGKVGHACAYATLTALVPWLPVGGAGRLWLWGVMVAHGFVTELIQTFVPTRSGAWLDVAIDLTGVTAGLALCGLGGWLWRRRQRGRAARGLPPPQAQEHGGGENQDADLLRDRQAQEVRRRVVP
jgi:hypothetical protein